MDTFRGHGNEEMKTLWKENDCELVIVPHNLTNKFQPLGISVKQLAKKIISHKCNKWYAKKVSRQLASGVSSGDVKVSLKLSDMKPLHAKRIVALYEYLKLQNDANLHPIVW